LSAANFVFRIGLQGALNDEYIQLLRDSGIPPNDLMVFALLLSFHIFVSVSLSLSWSAFSRRMILVTHLVLLQVMSCSSFYILLVVAMKQFSPFHIGLSLLF